MGTGRVNARRSGPLPQDIETPAGAELTRQLSPDPSP